MRHEPFVKERLAMALLTLQSKQQAGLLNPWQCLQLLPKEQLMSEQSTVRINCLLST